MYRRAYQTNSIRPRPHISHPTQYESEPIVQERLTSAMTMAWAQYEIKFLQAMGERNVPAAKAQDVVRGIFNDAVRAYACVCVRMRVDVCVVWYGWAGWGASAWSGGVGCVMIDKVGRNNTGAAVLSFSPLKP
jgi:hypothetical protein